MAIIKPIQETINVKNFHDKAYSFVVESVLGAEETPGIVVVSASTGYLLTTSLTNQPKREHTFKHDRQADGSWVACATVTLVDTEQSPVDGSVVIRDSGAEPVILTVDAASTAIARLQAPVSVSSQSTLTFAGTLPGKPSFQVITIARTHPVAPITLTTDAPDHFQLASDSQPAFSSSLTLIPPATGTYVHVRYVANRPGTHTGQLLIQGIYENKTVTLKGRTRVLLLAKPGPPKQSSLMKWGAGVLAMIIIGGVAYTGYSHRCQLFPDLCREAASEQTITNVSNPAPTRVNSVFSEKGITKRVEMPGAAGELDKSATGQVFVNTPAEQALRQPVSNPASEQQSVATSRPVKRNSSIRRVPVDQPVNPTPDERSRRQTPPTEESDLEQELNQPTKNQLD